MSVVAVAVCSSKTTRCEQALCAHGKGGGNGARTNYRNAEVWLKSLNTGRLMYTARPGRIQCYHGRLPPALVTQVGRGNG